MMFSKCSIYNNKKSTADPSSLERISSQGPGLFNSLGLNTLIKYE